MILGTAAFAEDISIGEISRPESAYNYSVNGLMTVSEVGEDTILCKQDNGGEIQLNISDETVFIDSNAMTAFNLNELKAGDKIYAEYSEAMTRSIPPQTSATLVASNVEEGGGVELISAAICKTHAAFCSHYVDKLLVLVNVLRPRAHKRYNGTRSAEQRRA